MKKVLITGGKGDIACSIKKLLIENNYDVYDPGKKEMDVSNEERVSLVINKYKPDILINNAGYINPQSIKRADISITKKHIDINLTAVFICSQIALNINPCLKIINICSAASVESHALWSEYCATKAAVAMATKCWAEDGVDVISLSPGRTNTKMRKRLFPNEDVNTLLRPEDFSKVVLNAINDKYEKGINIIVKKNNVEELINR